MTKIGVLTFHNTSDNYGQVLQYLATQEYLTGRGHEASLICSQGHRVTLMKRVLIVARSIVTRFFKKKKDVAPIKNTPQVGNEKEKQEIFKRWAEITKKAEAQHPRHFNDFRRRFFNMTVGTYEQILSKSFDAFCVGSDQTWSDAGEHYLLGWCKKKQKKISIAPSVGHRVYTDDQINDFKLYLQNFDFITVREKNGVDFCSRCGRNDAVVVLDPVFLIPSSLYNKYGVEQETPSKYVFVYMLGGEISEPIQNIIIFCKEHGLDVKYVESQGREEDVDKIYATVEEWIGLIRDAQYVITNSFHGMAMSIVYRKPFLVFPLVGLMSGLNERIVSLSHLMGCENRIYNNKMDILFNEIDWTVVDKKIKENKKQVDDLMKGVGL